MLTASNERKKGQRMLVEEGLATLDSFQRIHIYIIIQYTFRNYEISSQDYVLESECWNSE